MHNRVTHAVSSNCVVIGTSRLIRLHFAITPPPNQPICHRMRVNKSDVIVTVMMTVTGAVTPGQPLTSHSQVADSHFPGTVTCGHRSQTDDNILHLNCH